mmetsp:Transcript_28014/g.39461  ORF Transcript_28014/g.39461 Transcript_28014/m.39461 type:complete len:379 (+) Transcript_28014:82-1218(+)
MELTASQLIQRSRMRSRPMNHSHAEERLITMTEEEKLARSCIDHATLRAVQQSRSKSSSNLVWRSKVAQWFYDVVDQLGESRDIVFIAMNIVDRFCAMHTSMQYSRDEKAYEAAAMTGLFLALKLCGRRKLSASEITSMSQHGTDTDEIVNMGKTMIGVLSWDHKLITPINFVQAFLRLLPETVNDATKRVLHDTASFFTEASVCDSFFSGVASSEVAYAAILNAIGSDEVTSQLESVDLSSFYSLIQDTTSLDHEAQNVGSIRSRLHEIYLQSEESNRVQPQVIPIEVEEGNVRHPVRSRAVNIRTVSSDNVRLKPVVRSKAVTSFTALCPPSPSSSSRSVLSDEDETASSSRKRAISPAPMSSEPETKRTRRLSFF